MCVCTPRLRLPPAPRRSHLRRVCDETAAQAQPPQRTGYSPHSTERKLRQDTYTLSATRTPQTSSNSITIITYSCTPTMPLCVPIRGRGGASYHPSTCAKLADSPTPNCERTEHKRPNRRPIASIEWFIVRHSRPCASEGRPCVCRAPRPRQTLLHRNELVARITFSASSHALDHERRILIGGP